MQPDAVTDAKDPVITSPAALQMPVHIHPVIQSRLHAPNQ